MPINKKSKVLNRMGLANRDASVLTQKRRNIAVNAYYESWKASTNSGNSAATGPARASAEVVSEKNLGCTACFVLTNTTDANQLRYPPNVSSRKDTGSS
jgi:hypothetical protein